MVDRRQPEGTRPAHKLASISAKTDLQIRRQQGTKTALLTTRRPQGRKGQNTPYFTQLRETYHFRILAPIVRKSIESSRETLVAKGEASKTGGGRAKGEVHRIQSYEDGCLPRIRKIKEVREKGEGPGVGHNRVREQGRTKKRAETPRYSDVFDTERQLEKNESYVTS